MTSRILFSLLCLTLSMTAQAQVFKWVDANGKVTYSDVPPPKTAVSVEKKSYSSSDEPNYAFSYELGQAVKNMPVTLYNSAKCTPCDDGRNFLKQNGIPFSEKTVVTNADVEKLNSIGGGTQLPLLVIGRTNFKGFSYGDWRSGLTQAGYPESNQLPADYHYPAPQSAAPAAAAVTQNSDAPQGPAVTDQPARDPNGFQF